MVPLALACTLVFPPLGLMVSGGSALYAHRTGSFVLRNVLISCFVAVLVLTVALQNSLGL